MKQLILFSFILCFTAVGSYAQSIYDIQNAVDFFKLHRSDSGDYKNVLDESDIEGTPFLNDEFIEGTIYTYQKVQFNDIPLRYNIYNDELEFQTPDKQILALTTPEIVEKAVIGENSCSYIPYQSGKKMKNGFFIVLAEGDVNLYSRPIVLFQKAKEAAAYKEPEPAKFVERPNEYYLRVGMDAAEKIESKKDLVNFFSDHQEEIEAFIKNNKVKMGKEETLISLTKYYNSLPD
ncbi:hypothetical protein SLH46_12840 [Draconibacterium sp. IB214405]|uniref:hypothetical protein n=1 Tax=Draconibacterium sp. IB214405 TaxID=3097352 RepID=UPI002A1547A4|nr:hypothetical protein [Draconibacterium sp. IB214405]MDX8340080.1 hypothetical protein [Draconibacterium sp. IB214405]